MNKSFLSSKTIWIAILQGVAGVLIAMANVEPELGYLLVMKSMIDVTLRFLTEKPISL